MTDTTSDNKYKLAKSLDDVDFTNAYGRLQRNNDEVTKINEEIENLVYRRMLYLKDNKEIISKKMIQTARAWFIAPPKGEKDNFISKFNSEGFSNADIKNFVNHIREVYFDDTDEKFKKYDCVYIKDNSVWNDTSAIEFGFSNGTTTFAISIPLKPKAYYDTGYISGGTTVKFTNGSMEDMQSFPSAYGFMETVSQIKDIVETDGNPTTKTVEQFRHESGTRYTYRLSESVKTILDDFCFGELKEF